MLTAEQQTESTLKSGFCSSLHWSNKVKKCRRNHFTSHIIYWFAIRMRVQLGVGGRQCAYVCLRGSQHSSWWPVMTLPASHLISAATAASVCGLNCALTLLTYGSLTAPSSFPVPLSSSPFCLPPCLPQSPSSFYHYGKCPHCNQVRCNFPAIFINNST